MKLNKSLMSFGTSSFKKWTPILLFWTSYTTMSLTEVTRGQSHGLRIRLSKTSFYIYTWKRSAQRRPSTLSVTSSLRWRATQKWVPWAPRWRGDWRQVSVHECVRVCMHVSMCALVWFTCMHCECRTDTPLASWVGCLWGLVLSHAWNTVIQHWWHTGRVTDSSSALTDPCSAPFVPLSPSFK